MREGPGSMSLKEEEDDWMNPQRSLIYQALQKHSDGTFYWIQRKRAIPVSGNVSEIYRWDMWAEFTGSEERNQELKRLRAEHPAWHLRARTVRYVNGEARVEDASEYMDF